MSDKQGSLSPSPDWNSLLKHSSALGILKPDIVFNSYNSQSPSDRRLHSLHTSGTQNLNTGACLQAVHGGLTWLIRSGDLVWQG